MCRTHVRAKAQNISLKQVIEQYILQASSSSGEGPGSWGEDAHHTGGEAEGKSIPSSSGSSARGQSVRDYIMQAIQDSQLRDQALK